MAATAIGWASVWVQPAALDNQICVVWDPEDSFVNIRRSPNGQVNGRRSNGEQVEVVGIAYDNLGRPWVNSLSRGGDRNFFLTRLVRQCIKGRFTPDERIIP